MKKFLMNFVEKCRSYINKILTVLLMFFKQFVFYIKLISGLSIIILVLSLIFSTKLQNKIDDYFVNHGFVVTDVAISGNKHLLNDVFIHILINQIPSVSSQILEKTQLILKNINPLSDDALRHDLDVKNAKYIMQNGEWIFNIGLASKNEHKSISSIMLNLDEIVKKIASLGLVKNVFIKRLLPNSLLICVEEHAPVAYIDFAENSENMNFITQDSSLIQISMQQINKSIFDNLPIIYVQDKGSMDYLMNNIKKIMFIISQSFCFNENYDVFFELTSSLRFNMILIEKKHNKDHKDLMKRWQDVKKLFNQFNGGTYKNIRYIFVKLHRSCPDESLSILKNFLNDYGVERQNQNHSIMIDLRFNNKILVKKT